MDPRRIPSLHRPIQVEALRHKQSALDARRGMVDRTLAEQQEEKAALARARAARETERQLILAEGRRLAQEDLRMRAAEREAALAAHRESLAAEEAAKRQALEAQTAARLERGSHLAFLAKNSRLLGRKQNFDLESHRKQAAAKVRLPATGAGRMYAAAYVWRRTPTRKIRKTQPGSAAPDPDPC